MKRYVIDSSSLLKAFFTKEDAVDEVVEESVVSTLTFFEVGNIIWKRRDESINADNRDQLQTKAEVIGNTLKGISELSFDRTELKDVLNISLDLNVSFYDASFVYLAKRENLALLTEDRGLSAKADRLGLRTLSLEESLSEIG